MKIFSVFVLLIFFSVPYIHSEQKVNVDDWNKYQQYKQEQNNKISVSDKEYEEYKKYLQEKENINKKQNPIEIKQKNATSKIIKKELNFKLGKILNNSSKIILKNYYYNTSATTMNSNSEGWSIKMDYIHYLLENTGIGFGISYNSNFKSDDTNLINFDILLKQRFSISSREKTYLYLFGGLGYGHLTGITKTNYYNNGIYQYYVKVNDGFQWMLSFGLDFSPFIIDLNYACNYIGISTDLPSISGDASWCSFILSVGYKFEL